MRQSIHFKPEYPPFNAAPAGRGYLEEDEIKADWSLVEKSIFLANKS